MYPIYEAFDLEQIKRDAIYSTRVDFNIHSFAELHARISGFTQTILSFQAEHHIDDSLRQIEDEKALEKYIHVDLLRRNQAKNRNLADPKSNVEIKEATEIEVKIVMKKMKYNK